jgi:hypothetical protein
MRITLFSDECLFAQLVTDAVLHDNKSIIEIFLKMNRKLDDYHKETSSDRNVNEILLERIKAFLADENFDTEGYAWAIEDQNHTFDKEGLLFLACEKSSISVIETILYANVWSFEFIRSAVMEKNISDDIRTILLVYLVKGYKI